MIESPIYINLANIQEEVIQRGRVRTTERFCISAPLVMKSAAGHYIGEALVPMDQGNKGQFQPYARLTEYMSKAQAERELETYDDPLDNGYTLYASSQAAPAHKSASADTGLSP
jgi:hypothetical protein